MESKVAVNPVRKNKLIPWLFIAPALLLNVFVVLAPTLGTLILSLTDWNGIAMPEFVGLSNYRRLFADPVFWKALSNNAIWLLVFTTVPALLALVVANIMRGLKFSQMFFRSAYFMPNVISTLVTARIWMLIFSPMFGLNYVLGQMGITGLPNWLSDHRFTLLSVISVNIWQYWGFLMVLFLTAMQQADKELEEAGRIDGANGIQLFFHILLPQLRPTIMTMLMLSMIWSMSAFDYVYVMTNGGPGRTTELLATYMYKLAMYNNSSGYASTIALTMAAFSIIVLSIFNLLKRKGWDI